MHEKEKAPNFPEIYARKFIVEINFFLFVPELKQCLHICSTEVKRT